MFSLPYSKNKLVMPQNPRSFLYSARVKKLCQQILSARIKKGIGNNQIAPLANTTREQAIALLERTYQTYVSP